MFVNVFMYTCYTALHQSTPPTVQDVEGDGSIGQSSGRASVVALVPGRSCRDE